MTKSSNRLSVLDFIISVLTRYEKELDKNLARLERITRRLEEKNRGQASESVMPSCTEPTSSGQEEKRGRKDKIAYQQYHGDS